MKKAKTGISMGFVGIAIGIIIADSGRVYALHQPAVWGTVAHPPA